MAQREIASGFIYPQTATVLTGTTRFGKDAYKPFRILKGVDTSVQFFIKDQNGKSVKLRNKTFFANIIKSSDKDILISKPMQVVDTEAGITQLVLTVSDTLLLQVGYYDLVIQIREDSGEVIPLYNNSTYQQKYTIELLDNYIDVSPNVVIADNFSLHNNFYYSDKFAGTAQNPSTFGVSTIAVYGINFVGKVGVEATLESNPIGSSWFPIDLDRVKGKVEYNNFTGIEPYVFEGKFYWIRFVLQKTSGSIDKILYSC